jgi:DNA polymerase-3 subunit epsilon
VTVRQIIVVDVETSGLIPDHDVAVEVAWWVLETGERGCFIPPHDTEWVLQEGDPQALKLNGYRARLAGQPQDTEDVERAQLARKLAGNTLAGSNPAFDTYFLVLPPFIGHATPPWHHRLLDLSAYAAGVLNIPPTELPGLAAVCERLGIENAAPHTAEGDVDATGRCFLALMDLAGGAS